MIKSALNNPLGTHPLTPELHQTPRQTPSPILEAAASQIIDKIEYTSKHQQPWW